jgi:hypothetical protein
MQDTLTIRTAQYCTATQYLYNTHSAVLYSYTVYVQHAQRSIVQLHSICTTRTVQCCTVTQYLYNAHSAVLYSYTVSVQHAQRSIV